MGDDVPGAGDAPPGPEALRARPCAHKLKAGTARICAGVTGDAGARRAASGARTHRGGARWWR